MHGFVVANRVGGCYWRGGVGTPNRQPRHGLGAVAGTIPDLDVLGKFFLNELDNLGFHRGITHSLLFSVFGAIGFGWITDRLYRSKHHAWFAMGAKFLQLLWSDLRYTGWLAFSFKAVGSPSLSTSPLQLGFLEARAETILQRDLAIARSEFQRVSFLGAFTHILLDCFTTYGTQIFSPFSDARIAWGTIAVADPLYTLPFLGCLLVAARFSRNDSRRARWNWAGLGLSSLYLGLTIINHAHVTHQVEHALAEQGMESQRFFITPTILNNVLWNVVVDQGDEYLLAQYSLFDEVPISFHPVPKGTELLHNLDSDPTLERLRWFSAGYFNAVMTPEGVLQINDLRFGTFSGRAEGPEDYVFRFELTDNGQDQPYGFRRFTQGGPPKGVAESMFQRLVTRAKGLKSTGE